MDDTATPVAEAEAETLLRATVLSRLAGMFGPRVDVLVDPAALEELRWAIEALGLPEAARTLDGLETACGGDLDRLRSLHTLLFAQAKVAPYETAYTPSGLGGHTGTLADIAGFYRAFGFQVEGDRPDHVMAELEFAAFLLLAQSQARRDENAEGEEVCAEAYRTFLRDHVGIWLGAYATKLADAHPEAPYGAVAATAAAFVAAEASRLGVEPRRWDPSAVFTDEDDDMPLECSGCPQVPEAFGNIGPVGEAPS